MVRRPGKASVRPFAPLSFCPKFGNIFCVNVHSPSMWTGHRGEVAVGQLAWPSTVAVRPTCFRGTEVSKNSLTFLRRLRLVFG